MIGGYTIPKLSIENIGHVQQQPLDHPTTPSSDSPSHPSNSKAPASYSFNINPTGEQQADSITDRGREEKVAAKNKQHDNLPAGAAFGATPCSDSVNRAPLLRHLASQAQCYSCLKSSSNTMHCLACVL